MSSHNMMNPHGGVPVRRVMELFNPNENLLMRILSKENMAEAWKRVKANQGAPGVDGISIEQFPGHTRPLWAEIRQSLLTGRYQPSPARRVEIPKANGGTRPLGYMAYMGDVLQYIN
jgi:RNA-directed DNA polymerase